MDSTEQSPRGSTRSSFDTASLLAPSSGIFPTHSPPSVPSPLPHITHSPSAFSVLGRNAVIIPPPLPPSANCDLPVSKTGGKLCSPIMHQSASDALSSLASSSPGSCGWWSTTPPIVTTADFPGCGIAAIGDPFARAGLCGRTLGSSPHLPLPQPHRIVEEVLGHLYAKPATAELKAETQASGIHDTQQIATALSTGSIQNATILNVASATASVEKQSNSVSSNGDKVTVNHVRSPVSDVVSLAALPSDDPVAGKIEGNGTMAFPCDSVMPLKAPPKRKKRTPKAVPPGGADSSKNTKKQSNHKKAHAVKKLKEPKSVNKKLSSDSDSRLGLSISSNASITSSGGASSSDSSDSTDEEEREKQQQQLAMLMKQQKQLRRKVKKLTQASYDSSQQKVDTHTKESSVVPKSNSRSATLSKKPVPSPAHSSSTKAIAPKTFLQKPKPSMCIEEDVNMSVPLDLCVKKQEPMFEVSSSSLHSSFMTPTNLSKRQSSSFSSSFNQQQASPKLQPVPKKRGRKPKSIMPASILPPEMACHLKQSNRDFNNILLPQKMLAGNSAHRNSDSLQQRNFNSLTASKASLLLSNDVGASLSVPKKNFTLDSLLSESNGMTDFSLLESIVDSMPSSSMGGKSGKNKERAHYNSRGKRADEKAREFESFTKHDSSSGTDSDPDNDHSNSEDDVSTSTGMKRPYEDDMEEFSGKRRRVIPDEREIQIPLEHGWRRETRIRCFSRSGVRGEVAYYTPCGKKLKSYPEVVRYLIRNGITDISRDNFTFSTKANVGDFLEVTSTSPGKQDCVLLSEQEVVARINEVRAQKGRLGVQNRRSAYQRSVEQEEQQRQWEQKQIQHQLEQQEMLRQAREAKLRKQLLKEKANMAARNDRRLKVEEARRQKEQQRLLKQQERFERLEQIRIEREIRAQQLLEEQELKRQQAAFLREQERERRRQHMLLVRALETRKKQEERERKREEIMFEKRINKEKKMEQRRIELDYLRELKKPVEDMMLKDNTPLPTYNRIPGLKLPGKAFADVLMVFEFLHNFGETLGFDPDSLPTLNSIQMALLNLDDKHEEELLSVVHHLLVCAIEDPGVHHSSESATVLGQNLKDADITNNNVSEVLRLYFTAQNKRGKMCQLMQAKPFLCLNASQKAEILAHICNDLLGSRVLMRKIDSNIENVNVMRKDKWLIEGDLRRMKTVQQRRLLKAKQMTYEESKQVTPSNEDTPTPQNDSSDLAKDAQDKSDAKDTSQCDKEKLDDLDNDSGNDSDDTQAHGIPSDAEDDDLQLTNEELTKKVDKLTKQLSQYSDKLTKGLHAIRAVSLGQDRFHRRYWVLPKAGGVFVESMESSEHLEQQASILASSMAPTEPEKMEEEETPETNVELVAVKTEGDSIAEKKGENEDTLDTELQETKPMETEKAPVCDENLASEEEKTVNYVPSESEKPADDEELKDVKETNGELNFATFPPKDEEPPPSEELKEPPRDEVVEINLPSSVKKEEVVEEPVDEPMDLEKQSEDKLPSKSPETVFKVEAVAGKHTETKKKKGRSSEAANSSFSDDGDKKSDNKPDVNIFMPKFCDNNLGFESCSPLNHALHNSSDRKHSTVPNNPNWLLHSPFFASLLAGNMLFNGPMMPRESNGTYFNLPKNDSNNPFGPFLGLQPGMLSPEQLLKSLSEKQNNQKPWFSILPRMPCDDDSFSKMQLPKTPALFSPPNLLGNSTNGSTKPATSLPSSASAHMSGQLSNLQMEILNGMPPGFFLNPFLPPQFGPTYQSGLPTSNSSTPNLFTSSVLSHSSPMTDFAVNFGRPPSSSTPSSIPTPTATPGPNSQGCTTPTLRDSPTPSIKRLMIEKMTQEYEKPLPIANELQKGWWRITDPGQLKDIVNALHHRGIREKMLQKHLQKHFNYSCSSCSHVQDEDTDLEITDMDKEISQLPFGVPVNENPEEWSRDVALAVDLAILEQIENLEEKIDGASMQVKGWKPPPKLSTEPLSKFVPACELHLQIKCDFKDSPKERSPKKSAKKSARRRRQEAKKRALEAAEARALEAAQEEERAEEEAKAEAEAAEGRLDDEELKDGADDARAGDVDAEEKPSGVEALDESDDKIRADDETEKPADELPILPPGMMNPVEEGKNRLFLVEAAIERRYLKPPLGFGTNDLNRTGIQGNTTSVILDNGEEELIPVGLQKWRNAVQSCKNSSQLAMCLNYLENYTAWDKSIMRASCQFCHSGENEEMLLLCDGCDKGYHTYCFKPKMEKIPDGDWYCYECLNKATGDNVCVICGKKGKLLECASCPKCFHLSCLEPSLSKMPKGKWYCSGCSHTKPKKTSSKKSTPVSKEKDKEPKETTPSNCKKAETTTPTPKSKSSEKKEKKEKVRKEPTDDLAPCMTIVEEMEKHDDAWPFLSPVNTKQFPTYRKVIKKPMDLMTVRSKLESNQYRTREDFAVDMRLIFDNCETFNEDESPVGQAGHTLRAFFDTRWNEINST